MAALRQIAAIRARLLQSTDLVPIVGRTPVPDNLPAIYLGHIFDIKEPAYPCVTIRQTDGNLGVWAPRPIDPGQIMIDCFTKQDARQASEMDEFVEGMLHKQEVLTGVPTALFAEIRKTGWATSMWDSDTRAWRVTSRYLIRCFVS